jgi:hypothetical protein
MVIKGDCQANSIANYRISADHRTKVPAGTLALVRSPQALRCSKSKRASHIDPPASSYAIMRRACPYRGEQGCFRRVLTVGPELENSLGPSMSEFEGKAEDKCSHRVLRALVAMQHSPLRASVRWALSTDIMLGTANGAGHSVGHRRSGRERTSLLAYVHASPWLPDIYSRIMHQRSNAGW